MHAVQEVVAISRHQQLGNRHIEQAVYENKGKPRAAFILRAY
jgi:hypothetical protein